MTRWGGGPGGHDAIAEISERLRWLDGYILENVQTGKQQPVDGVRLIDAATGHPITEETRSEILRRVRDLENGDKLISSIALGRSIDIEGIRVREFRFGMFVDEMLGLIRREFLRPICLPHASALQSHLRSPKRFRKPFALSPFLCQLIRKPAPPALRIPKALNFSILQLISG